MISGATMDTTGQLTIIDEALAEALDRLDQLPVSPRVRELRARAISYRAAIALWPQCPPTVNQRRAMLDCVMALHAAVLGPRPSARPTRRPPGPRR